MSPQEDKTPKPSMERQIDENLRRVYQQTVEEKIPDRFLQLLAQLREQGPKS